MRPLKTVIVGFGAVADTLSEDVKMRRWFGASSHAQVLSEHKGFDWDAVVDPSRSARSRASGKWGKINVCANLGDLDEPGSYDCAVLAAPPGARLAALDALPGIRAVMVEKPLGRTGEEANCFLAACDERGILVQVPYWRRMVKRFRALADGELTRLLGRPQAVFGVYGNGLLNNGSHLIDLLRMLFGEVVGGEPIGEASASGGGAVPGDLNVAFALRFASGQLATVQPLDFTHYREVGIDVWGERGRLSVLQESLGVYHYGAAENRGLESEHEIDSGKPAVINVDVRGCFGALYDNLAEAVHFGSPLVSAGHSALESERIIQHIASRARDGLAA